MRTLRVTKVISDLPQFARRHKLRLPRKKDELNVDSLRSNKGTFGEIWSAGFADAKHEEPPLLIKRVKEPYSLVDSVADLHSALKRKGEPEWTERLLGLPYAIVIAEIDGEECEVTFMLDLAARGYEEVDGYFTKSAAHEYRERPSHERVEFAYTFARAAALLESIRFLHGDQNIENLMLNPVTLDVQIIDLDAGAILITGDERALAEGKRDNCVPPEARVPDPMAPSQVDKSVWDIEAERWSVGILVGQLALGFEPSFFLKSNARVLDAYAEEGPWPTLRLPSSLLIHEGEAAYRYWLPAMEAAPGRTVETFGRFFRAGTRGAARPTARDWVEALDAARRKPKFKYLRAAATVAPEGTEVVLSWEAEEAEYVEHPLLGKLPPKGEKRVVVNRTERQRMTAVNFYGRVEEESEVIRAVPLPRLTTIPLAGFPELNLDVRIATGAPARPPRPSQPRLTRALGVPPSASVSARGMRPLPPPPHLGSLFKPIPVAGRIRRMKRKEPTE